MAVDTISAVDLVKDAITSLRQDQAYKRRALYAAGVSALPFAPPGLETDYALLRAVAGTPLVKVAIHTVARRIRTGGIHRTPTGPPDAELTRVLASNSWDSRQTMLWESVLTHGYGIASVWPNPLDPSTPTVSIEDPGSVRLVSYPDNPWRVRYAVKLLSGAIPTMRTAAGAEVPGKDVAYLYTEAKVRRYVSQSGTEEWTLDNEIDNPLRRVPFILFASERHANGTLDAYIDPLIPIAQALDTIRFDLLLAAQFAAYRQRIATGVDPVVRDESGNPIFRTHHATYPAAWSSSSGDWARTATGAPAEWTSEHETAGTYELREFSGDVLDLDGNGLPIPIVRSPGKVGVDRFLVFPGADSKVYDLPESNLENYIKAAEYLSASFSAASFIPSQYLAIGDWSNVSGDTMEANEAGLRTFVSSLQISFSDSVRDLIDLIDRALGRRNPVRVLDVSWRNMEPRSLTQVASAASQLVPNGAPLEMFLEMIGSPFEVQRWMTLAQNSMSRAATGDLAAALTGPKPDDDANEAADVKAKADALGVLIRSGVEPDVAANMVGLTGLEFTGAVPTSLRLPQSDAAALEGGDSGSSSVPPAF